MQENVRIGSLLLEELRLCPNRRKNGANGTSLSHDMEGHTKKCVERNCEWANNTTEPLYKTSHHVLMTIVKGRIGNGGRTVESLLSNRLEMPVRGTHW